MGGVRQLILERQGAPEKPLRSGLHRFFMLGMAISTTATAQPANGTNINAVRHNNPMAGQMLQPPAVTMEQQAAQAVSALRDFIYTGNQQKKSEFLTIYNANGANLQFANALAGEFRAQVVADQKLGPIVSAYRAASGGTFSASEFMAFTETVRNAALSGSPALLNDLRDTALVSPEFVRNVVDPLLGIYTIAATPVRVEQMQDSANVAGGMFIGLMETGRLEEGSRPPLKDLTARKSQMKEISAGILNEMKAHTARDGTFEPGYLDSFMRVLGEQCPQCISIVNAFAKDRGVEKLGYKGFEELLDLLPKLFTQLMAPGYDMENLSIAYGRNLAAATRSYIIQMSVPRLEGISVESLTKRVGEVDQFVAEKKLQGVGGIIDDWKKRLAASPGREELIALNAQIPSVSMLEEDEILMARSGRQVKAVLEGKQDFYRTIGTRVWVPRLQTMAKSVRESINDQTTGKFATAMLVREGIDLQKIENLVTVANNANTAIPRAIATLDELLRTTPLDRRQARLDAIGAVFGKGGIMNGTIDALTDAIAAFNPGADRAALRAGVAERLMIQFVVPVPGRDPVETLKARYVEIAENRQFLAFRTNFTSEIDRYIAGLAAEAPARSADQMLNDSRREMAVRARELFASMPLEYAYGIYLAMGSAYGENWERGVRGNTAQMARMCAVINGFSTVPAPYASYALGIVGRNLIRNYDDASIAVIATAISGSSQIFLGGDYQHMLIQYYKSLPGRMDKLFPDITAMQKERREGEYDVRIRTPSEDDKFTEIFVPAAGIRVRVPKRVYEEWQNTGILSVAKSANIVNTAGWPPDLIKVMAEFIDEPMLEGRVNLPLPALRLPMLLQGIQFLAPDFFPPVGEYISAMASADYAYYHQYTVNRAGTKTAETSTATINAAQEFVREGATTTARESYEVSEGMGQDKRQAGSIELQNVRVKQNYNINTASVDFEQTGTRLQTIGAMFSGIAPRGAETAVLFRRDEAARKEVEFTAHIYQRGPNGSFVLADAATLSADEAKAIYEQAFERPLQRLYGAGRGQPKEGGVRAMLDGAVLFSGPFTSDYTAWEDFQGAGTALQVKEFGGYADYEQTRRGRAAGAFGRFMPENQSLWVGRLTAENLRVEADGKRRLYGEFAYLKTDRREIAGFVGLAKNMTWDDFQGAAIYNAMFNRSVLGMRYGGVGIGRLLTETGTGRETMGGGRIYAVSEDVVNGVVASALYRTFTEQTEQQAQQPLTLTADARTFYSNNTGLTMTLQQAGATEAARQRVYLLLTSTDPADQQMVRDAGITVDANNRVTLGSGSAAWLRTYAQQNASATGAATTVTTTETVTQTLVSAGVREMIGRNLMLETGAGWDVLNDEGAGFLNFDWVPTGYGVSDIGLHAYAIGRDRKTTAIVGGVAEFTPSLGIRTSVEGYYPGLGELRLRMPWIDFSVGGGRLEGMSEGVHAGLRIPVGPRWTLGAATSFSNDYFTNESKRMSQQEGIAGAIFSMPYSNKAGFRLANIFGSIAFIHQNEYLFGLENAEARQWDVNAGLNWLEARSSMTFKLGAQYWEAAHQSALQTEVSATAGLEATARTWKPGRRLLFVNPALSANLAVGSATEEDLESGEKTTTTNVRVNVKATTGF